jgi:integrase
MLSQDIIRYVELHRAMGFKFRTQHSLLKNFSIFASQKGDAYVYTQTVLDWAARAPSPPQRHNRLATVRRFALAMQAEDVHHQVPPADVFGREWFKRRTPYIYTREQIARLINAAAQLPPKGSRRRIRRYSDCSRQPACVFRKLWRLTSKTSPTMGY